MKTGFIYTLTRDFESYAQKTLQGVEFWFARDLQNLLGYGKWENFQNVILKAKTACEASGHTIDDHFPDVRKMVDLGSGSQREIDDINQWGQSRLIFISFLNFHSKYYSSLYLSV